MELILASASPRRQELLSRLGLDFTVIPARGEESLAPGLTPQEQVLRLAGQKALEVYGRQSHSPGRVILSADTVVVLDGSILGKPKNPDDAVRMLSALSGRSHQVLTGVCVLSEDRKQQHCEETQVFFRKLTASEISAYVKTGEPMDKAGAYGIQGYGALFAEKIIGDYFNVMGLPLCAVGQLLRQAGIPILEAAL